MLLNVCKQSWKVWNKNIKRYTYVHKYWHPYDSDITTLRMLSLLGIRIKERQFLINQINFVATYLS